MASRGSTLVIRMRPKGQRVQVQLKGTGRQPLRWVVDRNELMSARRKLADDLLTFKGLVGNEVRVSEWEKVQAAMHFLLAEGHWLGSRFTGGNPLLRDQVEKYVRKSCPTWLADARPPILIEVQSPSNLLFPIDLLPLFDRAPPSRIENRGDLWRFARSFLGFSGVVRRTLSDTPTAQDATLRNDPALPVKLLYDATLVGAQKEAEFFSSARYFAFERPWPGGPADQGELRRRLISFMVDPKEGIDRRLDAPDQILHFACHCDTEWESPERYSIRLSGVGGPKLTITMQELEADLYGSSVPHKNVSLPLVFMNACGTGKIIAGAVSYPKVFLSRGNRGFVGTETRIPDAFAAAFSERFYRNLLRGLTLGDAIYDAKLYFLTKRKNPMGVLYTAYADTDIHVKRPLGKEELGD